MNELEAKRKALAAESEVYRETLKLEFQTLLLCGLKARRKLTIFKALPFLSLAGPLLVKPRTGWPRLLSVALLGWKIYRKLTSITGGLASPRKSAHPQPQDRSPAAHT